MSTMTTNPSAAKPSPCGCHQTKPVPCTCCGITCFERPNYFCGHLLTDADLSLEQKYLIEKNKLYHRAIDGYGIACGLKVTCDCDCRGNVLVHQGFAIDDCGHDIVVCEAARFDVIGALRKKGWLVSDEPEDECEEEEEESECRIKQCFYLTICYDETQASYETPFQSSCTSGPKQCLPTRIKEGYRFDLVKELPPEHCYLEDLMKRFEHCFEIHRKGEIGSIMSERRNLELLKGVLGGEYQEWDREWDYCQLFCTLRAWFLNRLKIEPDEFNCALFEEVQCLSCPGDYEGDDDDECWEEYCGEVRDAYRRLLLYMERYQFDCAVGELIFSCEQPCEAHCLVLSTVEVVDGRLLRVCNTPRKYLWSAANFVQVLLYYLLPGSHMCRENHDHHDDCKCCPSYDRFLPDEFIREFEYRKDGRFLAATSSLRAFEAIVASLRRSFDFTDTKRVSPILFEKVKAGQHLDINVEVTDRPASTLSEPNFLEALVGNTLLQPRDSVALYRGYEEERSTVVPNAVKEISRDRSIGAKIEKDLNEAIARANKALEDLRAFREESAASDEGEQTPRRSTKKGGSADEKKSGPGEEKK